MDLAKKKSHTRVSAPILICLLGLLILVQGCGVVRARNPVPPAYLDEAQVVGMPDVMGYGDSPDDSTLSKMDGVDFNLAVIPEDFKVERKEEFDKNYMNQLFNLGYDQGRRGYAWMKYPPGLKQAVEGR